MKSIEKQLVRTLSLSIAGLLFIIFSIVDFSVDRWVDSQYQENKIDRLHMLMSLVEQNEQGLSLHFAKHLLPRFNGTSNPEYYQLWVDGKTWARSESLDLFQVKQIPFRQLDVGQISSQSWNLPDGRRGRIFYSHFVPENLTGQLPDKQKTVLIAYATSSQSIEFVLDLIDFSFIFCCVITIIFIWLFVGGTVRRRLQPIWQLNKQIKAIDFSQTTQLIRLDQEVEELLPISNSLNHFIKENRLLYLTEKRLSSDVAHELKTPIAELISLAEVTVRFPQDGALQEDFPKQVLAISKRLNRIVNQILLLHKSQGRQWACDEWIDVYALLDRMLESYPEVRLIQKDQIAKLQSNVFALETILKNLFENAINYKKMATPIEVSISKPTNAQCLIAISNIANSALTDEDLASFFLPLWQKDSARSSSEHFGLGLSIAKAFAEASQCQLEAKLLDGKVCVSLLIQ